jgi:hypothetical protein
MSQDRARLADAREPLEPPHERTAGEIRPAKESALMRESEARLPGSSLVSQKAPLWERGPLLPSTARGDRNVIYDKEHYHI